MHTKFIGAGALEGYFEDQIPEFNPVVSFMKHNIHVGYAQTTQPYIGPLTPATAKDRKLVAVRTFKAKEEAFYNHSDSSNSDLLTTWGFIVEKYKFGRGIALLGEKLEPLANADAEAKFQAISECKDPTQGIFWGHDGYPKGTTAPKLLRCLRQRARAAGTAFSKALDDKWPPATGSEDKEDAHVAAEMNRLCARRLQALRDGLDEDVERALKKGNKTEKDIYHIRMEEAAIWSLCTQIHRKIALAGGK